MMTKHHLIAALMDNGLDEDTASAVAKRIVKRIAMGGRYGNDCVVTVQASAREELASLTRTKDALARALEGMTPAPRPVPQAVS